MFRIVTMNDNNNNSDLDIMSSAIDGIYVDSMNEPLIFAQIINPVTPTIMQIPENFLSTRIETAINEHNHLSACARKDDNATCSNSDFDARGGYLTDAMDSYGKDDAVCSC